MKSAQKIEEELCIIIYLDILKTIKSESESEKSECKRIITN